MIVSATRVAKEDIFPDTVGHLGRHKLIARADAGRGQRLDRRLQILGRCLDLVGVPAVALLHQLVGQIEVGRRDAMLAKLQKAVLLEGVQVLEVAARLVDLGTVFADQRARGAPHRLGVHLLFDLGFDQLFDLRGRLASSALVSTRVPFFAASVMSVISFITSSRVAAAGIANSLQG
jgi:hypothetical protein